MARKLIVEIVGDASSLQRTFKQTDEATKKLDRNLSQTTRGAIVGTGAFRSMGRSVAFASGAFLGGAGLIAGVKASVSAASNLNEQTSKSNVVFGQSAKVVESWSRTTVESMGLASDQALETASSFGALLRPIGLTGTEAARQAEKLTKLGADLASFYNTSVQDALDAIRSGLVGESEPLRRYGVLLSETRVQQEALKETGKKHVAQLTNQEKVLARIAIVYRDTASAQGDFVRTSGGFANQMRIAQANIRQLEIEIGTKLVPTLSKAVGFLNDFFDQFKKNQGTQDNVTEKTHKTNQSIVVAAAVFKFFGKVVRDDVKHVDQLGDAIDRLGFGFKDAVFQAGKLSKVQLGPEQIRLLGLAGAPPTTGEDVGQRGAAARTTPGAVARAAASTRASLTFQLSLLQEQLAKAELTATERDDRAVLVRIAALTRQKIAKTKELGARTKLEQDLAGVENQIRQIDQNVASDREAARQKEIDARRKEAEKQKKFADRIKAENDKLQAHFRAQEAAFKARQAKLREALASAVTDVRNLLGGLFTGPVFNAPAGVLGITNARAVGGTVGAKGFVSNLRQQTAQLVAFNNDLARLARRGAPGGLISQLRQGGLEQAPLIHQLATAGRPTLQALFKSFAQQEKVIQQIAHADVQAKTVTIVTSNLKGSGTTPSSQRRGRQAGVPSTIGAFINP